MEDKNTVIIGSKPLGAYKSYVLSLISSGQLEKAKVVARGPKNVYKALSLAEVIKRMGMNIGYKVSVKTEEYEFEGKKKMLTAVEVSFNKA